MSEEEQSRQEMSVYCRYLMGKDADEQSLNLFAQAVRHQEVKLSENEQKLLHFLLHQPWSVSCIDAALGLFKPHHVLRRRMIIAFAILETNPLYYDFFRPRVIDRSHLAVLISKSIMEVMRATAGRFILLFF